MCSFSLVNKEKKVKLVHIKKGKPTLVTYLVETTLLRYIGLEKKKKHFESVWHYFSASSVIEQLRNSHKCISFRLN